ncbi:MAG TPA: hypothetical protein VHQ69_16910 [Methylomirabilota bacterium]|jgi:hypothetical protein|nr:hypothetical protein [Methylomirabilota bacterium]
MMVYVQVASAELDGQRWYTVAAGPNRRLADWLARALEVEGQRAARAIPHDELLATGGELAVGMAHNDLISLDPELLK